MGLTSASNITRCYASGTLVCHGRRVDRRPRGDNQGGSNANNYWNTGTTAFAGIGTGFATGATGLTATQMKAAGIVHRLHLPVAVADQ